MKAAIIQPPYYTDHSRSDECFEFEMRMLDECDETIDLIVLPEMADIKTAVSEAVTNAIVHGYRGREDGMVRLSAEYGADRILTVWVDDTGCGIRDIQTAMQPF